MSIDEEILYQNLKTLIDDDEERFASKVRVLGEETVHHIDEEDEDIFDEAKEAHRKGEIDLDALGEKLRARQAALYEQIAATGETREVRPGQVDKTS